MNIRLATELDQTAWDAYVLRHENGLAYHQYAWCRAVYAAYHLSARYLLAEQTGRICGVLPLIDFKKPFVGHSFVSLPYCDQGGCLADDPLTASALLARAIAMSGEDKVDSIELRQLGRQNAISCQGQTCRKVRMVLDLPASSDVLLSGLKSKLRSQIGKPMRDGLTAKLGGLELVSDFYQIYCENMHNLGSPVHSRKWLESVVHHYGRNARVGLVLTPKGEPAAGGIILLHGKTVSIPWASSLRKFNTMNPNMLLYWTFLAFSSEHGFSRFDFGRSTPGEGTYRFKEQWGAYPVALNWQHINLNGQRNSVDSQLSGVRPNLEKIWMRMPIGLCNSCGPLVRRYVSL